MSIKLAYPEAETEEPRSKINVIEPRSDFGDPAMLPPRDFIYGRHYLRGAVSVTVAAGGIGKSTLAIVEGIAIALGRNLLGVPVPVGQNVLYINLEEPAVEIKRRVYAACQNYCVDPRELNNKFHYQSGLDHPIIAASMERGRIVVGNLPEAFGLLGYDLLIIDPFIGSHAVGENDNTAIDAVVKQFAQVAAANSMAVEIVHHVRKPSMGVQTETGVSDARGASALVNAARSVRVLNAMSEAEEQQFRVADRRSYFRATDGKSNYQRLGSAEWFQLVPIDLPNGDSVATLNRWNTPSAFEGVSTADMMRVRAMTAETPYRNDSQSDDWVGNAVAEVLDLDVVADKRRIKTLLGTWIANGVLAIERRVDPATRHKRTYVVPGTMPD